MPFLNSRGCASFREFKIPLAINLIKALKNNFFMENGTLLNIVLCLIIFHNYFELLDFEFGVWLKSPGANIFFLLHNKIQGFQLLLKTHSNLIKGSNLQMYISILLFCILKKNC